MTYKKWTYLISLILIAAVACLAQETKPDSIRPINPMESNAIKKTLKNPTCAMIKSATIPGWGQFYNEKVFKGIIIAGIETSLVANAVIQNQYAQASTSYLEREFYRDNRGLSIWWLTGVILYSVADAYVDAHLFEFDEKIEISWDLLQQPGDRNRVLLAKLDFQLDLPIYRN